MRWRKVAKSKIRLKIWDRKLLRREKSLRILLKILDRKPCKKDKTLKNRFKRKLHKLQTKVRI